MARWDDKTITRRAAAAQALRAKYLPYVRACLQMAMPWRLDVGNGGAAFEALFDDTAVNSVMRLAYKFQRTVTPPMQRWFEMEAGPLVPDAQAEVVNRVLESTTKILHASFDASSFHPASLESYADLAVGTGALLGLEGDDNCPTRWISAPAWAVSFEEGPAGRVDNVFWEKSFKAYLLRETWPQAEWSAKTKKLISDGRDTDVQIRQSTYYDPDLGRWRVALQECGQHAVVWDSDRDRTNPWTIYRYWTTPGDPWGRGPVMLALPNIRVANKAVEMIFEAAAYQLAPPLMVGHDGVVNPDNMNLSPRSIIRVARTGGPMGPSIAPLPIGGNIELGNIVLEDLRQGIKRSLHDTQLPPDTGAVRSASEIIQRSKDLQGDDGAAFGRMNHEFVPQVVARQIDLLDRRKVATIDFSVLKIDQLTMRVKLTGPMAKAQNLEDVQTVVQFWELAKGLGGEEAFMMIANLEDGLPRLAKLMGVPLGFVNDPQTRAALAKAAGKMVAQQMAGGAAATQKSQTPEPQELGL